MPADLHIRTAGPADMPALLALFRGFMDYLGDPSPPDASLADAIAPVFTDPSAAILIGAIDGEPVAYAHVRTYYSVWMAAPECFLEDLFVYEHRRDGGIGRQMLAAVFDWAKARACRRVRLDTNEGNERGIHLYESVGFSCTRDSYEGGHQRYYTAYIDD